MNEVQLEGLKCRIREFLHRDNVKLWLSPYTHEEDGSAAAFPQDLVQRYSQNLQISTSLIADALESLRVHAVEKLAAKKKFSSSGLATIKVTLTGVVPAAHNNKLQLETQLQTSGGEFKKQLSRALQIPTEQMKIISSGHLIEDGKSLSEQGLLNSCQVMVICLSQAEMQARQTQANLDQATAQVTQTRRAAEVLSSRKDGGGGKSEKFYLEINDQSGKPINLPEEERKSLALALTLHEKGRALLNRKNFSEALLLLVEADKEFSQCRSEILKAVDNYAVLCLDLVWCYLCLKSVNNLPDAEEKLSKCEQCFKQSYGADMERLVSVRGGSGQEMCLFVRLYLLKAVCAFHRGHYESAMELLDKAEEGINKLQIDDNKLSQLLNMGFTDGESRTGLRVCQGDVTSVVEYITKRREEKHERRNREKKERESRKLGRTANGNWVDCDVHKILVEMGFPSSSAAEALRQANNDVDKAVQVLQEHPDLLNLPSTSGSQDFNIPEELIAQVVSMGFSTADVGQMLQKHSGSIQTALEELFTSGAPTSQAGSSRESENKEDPDIEKALKDLVSCVPEDEDAYLDINLDDEASVITEYRTLLASLRSTR